MIKEIINVISLWALPAIILIILTVAIIRKVPIYEAFVEGAKEIWLKKKEADIEKDLQEQLIEVETKIKENQCLKLNFFKYLSF